MSEIIQDIGKCLDKTLQNVSISFLKSAYQDMHAILNDTLGDLCKCIEADRGFVVFLSKDNQEFSLTHEWVKKSEYKLLDVTRKKKYKLENFKFWSQLIHSPSVVVLDTLDHLPPEAHSEMQLLFREKVLSNIVIPLVIEGKTLGGLGLSFNSKYHTFTPKEIELLTYAAELISNFINKSYENFHNSYFNPSKATIPSLPKNHTKQLEMLSQAAISLLKLDTAEQVLAFAGKTIFELQDHSIVLVNEYDYKDNAMTPKYTMGIHSYIRLLIEVLGSNPFEKKYPLDIFIDDLDLIKLNKLHHLKNGIYELTFGKISHNKANLIKKVTGIGEIYGCGIRSESTIYGTVTIIMKKGVEIAPSMLETFLKMVSQALYRLETHSALMETRNNLNDILDRMSEGVLKIDTEGSIWYVNQAIETISGYRSFEIQGQNISSFLAHADDVAILNDRIFNMNLPEINEFKIRILNAEKKERKLLVRGRRLLNDQKELSGYLGVILDITETEKAEAVQKELDGVKRLHTLKQHFLSNMSHEMLTPLNGVKGISEVLYHENLTEHQKNMVEIITSSSNELQQVIQDVLQFTKLEKGINALNPIDFSLCDLIYHNYTLFSAAALNKQIEMQLDCEFDQNWIVRADKVKINQVLSNVLGNAVKFTPVSGKIKIHVLLIPQASTLPPCEANVIFEITDSGPGISDEYKEAIFEDFYQVDGSNTRNHDGMGLGLSVAKQLTEILHGELDCHSELGKGSVFRVNIPVRLIEEKGKEEKFIFEKNITNKKSYVILQSSITQFKFMEILFKNLNLELNGAKTQEELWEIVQKEDSWVILIDPYNKDLDVKLLVSALQNKKHTSITLLGIGEREVFKNELKEKFAELDDYLPSPLQLKDLKDKLLLI